MKIKTFLYVAALALLANTGSMMATPITFTGSLPNPNALFEVSYTIPVGTTATVTIATSGVPGGDFFPVLWLFNSTDTTQLDKNDPNVNQDASMTETNQGPGTYDVILTTFDQHYCKANTVCNGVVYGNTGWSYNGSFFGRSTDFTLTISSAGDPINDSTGCVANPGGCINASPNRAYASAPEPATAGMLLAGGAFLGWFKFRRRRNG